MKSLLIVLMFVGFVFSQNLNQTVQPGSFHYLAGRSFAGSDSSYRPQYVHNNGVMEFCRGIMVTDTCDSAIIMIHGEYNSSEVRFPFKIGRDQCGYMVPVVFDKIYKSNTKVWVAGSVVADPLEYMWVTAKNE